MKFLTNIIAVLFGIGVYLSLPTIANAACTTQYGGTISCPPTDLTINKLVAKPRAVTVTKSKDGITQTVETGSLNFVENLGIEDAFAPGQEIVFKLVVYNNSVKEFTNVRVVDKIPDFIKLVSYPGTIEDNGKLLVFYFDRLGVGERREQEIVARVVDAKDLTGPTEFCELNRGEISAEDRAHNDSAQFCVSKEKPAKKLPVAGFNELFVVIPFLGAGLGGFALIKKSQKNLS